MLLSIFTKKLSDWEGSKYCSGTEKNNLENMNILLCGLKWKLSKNRCKYKSRH